MFWALPVASRTENLKLSPFGGDDVPQGVSSAGQGELGRLLRRRPTPGCPARP